MVDKKITAQKRIKMIKNNTTLEILIKNHTTYKKFTYIPWASQKFQKIFKDFNSTLVPTNKHKFDKCQLQR